MTENKKRLMVVDAMNAFIRAWIVDPSISQNGELIGGYKGFIKILQKLCREMRPDEIIIAWDGAGDPKRGEPSTKTIKVAESPCA